MLAAVHSHAPDVPVIVDYSVAETVVDAGAHAFLSKPFDGVKLHLVLAELCNDKPLIAEADHHLDADSYTLSSYICSCEEVGFMVAVIYIAAH